MVKRNLKLSKNYKKDQFVKKKTAYLPYGLNKFGVKKLYDH